MILTPTRELALQISECLDEYARYTPVRHGVMFGGVNQRPQVTMLQKGIDILVATPGRLLDLMSQGFLSLDQVKYFVLDEADRMLDMGFIHDIKRILPKLPKEKQTLFFSATMPDSIVTLASALLKNPVKITITPESPTVDAIEQFVYFVEKAEKGRLLISLLRKAEINRYWFSPVRNIMPTGLSGYWAKPESEVRLFTETRVKLPVSRL